MASSISSRKDSGLNKRVPSTQAGSQPSLVVKRKKLPWLDGKPPQQIPGAFDLKQNLELAALLGDGTAPTPGAISTAPTAESAAVLKRLSISPVVDGPAEKAAPARGSISTAPTTADLIASSKRLSVDPHRNLELASMLADRASWAAPGSVPTAPAAPILISAAPTAESIAVLKRLSVKSLGEDPSLRAVGSTPSLRQGTKSIDRQRTLSLTSDPRPGIKPTSSKQHAKRALGVAVGDGKPTKNQEDYIPSEYSTTNVSSEADRTPPTTRAPPKNHYDRALYDRQVQRAATRKEQEASRGPFHVARNWLQSELDLPLGEVAPTSEKRKCGRTGSCADCDATLKDMARQRELNDMARQPEPSPKTQGVPRRATSVPSSKPKPPLRQQTKRNVEMPAYLPPRKSVAQARPVRTGTMALKPDKRRTTLREMPNHLMAGSSSSGIPSRLVTSTEVSSSSPNASPRAAVRVPTMPPPAAPASRDLRRETRNLDRGVTGLDNLMDEALIVAKNAANSGRPDDVAQILEGASTALRNASAISMYRRSTGRMSEPFQLSPHESGDSPDDSDSSDDGPTGPGLWSKYHSREDSVETAPTLMTAQSSQQPLFVEQYTKEGKIPQPQRVTLDRASDESITRTPPRLYQPASADSIVRDFAYAKLKNARAQSSKSLSVAPDYGSASDYCGDHGESVAVQPGIRRSIALEKMVDKPGPELPAEARKPSRDTVGRTQRGTNQAPGGLPHSRRFTKSDLRELEHVPTDTVPLKSVDSFDNVAPETVPHPRRRGPGHHHISDFFENAYATPTLTPPTLHHC